MLWVFVCRTTPEREGDKEWEENVTFPFFLMMFVLGFFERRGSVGGKEFCVLDDEKEKRRKVVGGGRSVLEEREADEDAEEDGNSGDDELLVVLLTIRRIASQAGKLLEFLVIGGGLLGSTSLLSLLATSLSSGDNGDDRGSHRLGDDLLHSNSGRSDVAVVAGSERVVAAGSEDGLGGGNLLGGAEQCSGGQLGHHSSNVRPSVCVHFGLLGRNWGRRNFLRSRRR